AAWAWPPTPTRRARTGPPARVGIARVREMAFEPTTTTLATPCATPELLPRGGSKSQSTARGPEWRGLAREPGSFPADASPGREPAVESPRPEVREMFPPICLDSTSPATFTASSLTTPGPVRDRLTVDDSGKTLERPESRG